MIYDEKAKCLRREDGSLVVYVEEIEDGRIYFDLPLRGLVRVSMLEIEEIIALGGRDYAAGRRAGIEEALATLEKGGHGRLTIYRQVRALLEAKT